MANPMDRALESIGVRRAFSRRSAGRTRSSGLREMFPPLQDRFPSWVVEGARVVLVRPVSRPGIFAEPGSTGTITEVSTMLISVQMDEPLDGAEEWENEIQWAYDDLDRFQIDVQPVRTASTRRYAISSDPYQRAQERADSAACKMGLLGALKAMKKRALQVGDYDKLVGLSEFLGDLSAALAEVEDIVDKKLG